MTARERVLRTLEFNSPDRIPIDLWVLPATREMYPQKMDELLERYKPDIRSVVGPMDHAFNPAYYKPGKLVDEWGSVWHNLQPGIIGEVKEPILHDYAGLAEFRAPVDQFRKQWDDNLEALNCQVAELHGQGQFVLGGWISLFERLQYLRGTEDLYCDIALDEPELHRMIEIMMDFWRVYLDNWLQTDVDAIGFGDDWGTQISMLIAPDRWRELFKPLYQELFDKIKVAGKKVFFHSDGYIYDLYCDLVEMGADAVNSQLWCMDLDKIAQNYGGRITFWGEVSRQTIMPHGTPEEVREAIRRMKRLFWRNGGLIGQSETNRDVPLENIVAFFEAWNEEVI